jgi:hypothetical protein
MYLTKEQIFGMYLGQKVYFEETKEIMTLDKVNRYGGIVVTNPINDDNEIYAIDDLKLILRTYEDLTTYEEDVWKSLIKIEFIDNEEKKISTSETVESIEFLISIGIDVFGLNEKGWAVYENEILKN